MLILFYRSKCCNKVIRTTFMTIQQYNRRIIFCYTLMILERAKKFYEKSVVLRNVVLKYLKNMFNFKILNF